MTRDRSDEHRTATKERKVANRLMALSSAAVLAVYAAGYVRTRAAAQRFTDVPAMKREAPPLAPAAPLTIAPVTPSVTAPPATAQKIDVVTNRVRTPPTSKTNARPARPAPKAVSKPSAPEPHPAEAAPASAPSPAAAAANPTPLSAQTTAVAAETPVVEAPAPTPPQAPARPQWKDGTYTGWGTSRHGDIQASVVIDGGRIVSATISQCLTRYSCSWIAALPPQVVARQSPETDYVSGATQSTNAFYYAVVEALSKAK